MQNQNRMYGKPVDTFFLWTASQIVPPSFTNRNNTWKERKEMKLLTCSCWARLAIAHPDVISRLSEAFLGKYESRAQAGVASNKHGYPGVIRQYGLATYAHHVFLYTLGLRAKITFGQKLLLRGLAAFQSGFNPSRASRFTQLPSSHFPSTYAHAQNFCCALSLVH